MAKESLKSYTLTFLPFDVTLDVPQGTKILDAVKKANLPLKASCGGEGTCGECIVQVKKGRYEAKPTAVFSNQLISQGYALALLAIGVLFLGLAVLMFKKKL